MNFEYLVFQLKSAYLANSGYLRIVNFSGRFRQKTTPLKKSRAIHTPDL